MPSGSEGDKVARMARFAGMVATIPGGLTKSQREYIATVALIAFEDMDSSNAYKFLGQHHKEIDQKVFKGQVLGDIYPTGFQADRKDVSSEEDQDDADHDR